MWGFVGGLALVIGALIAFALRPSKHAVAYVMAFGAGVLISAVAYDLTADAFELGGGDAVAIGLAAGALVYAGLSLLTRPRGGGDRTEAGARALALGALLDGIPESAAIGLTLSAAARSAAPSSPRCSSPTFPSGSPRRRSSSSPAVAPPGSS